MSSLKELDFLVQCDACANSDPEHCMYPMEKIKWTDGKGKFFCKDCDCDADLFEIEGITVSDIKPEAGFKRIKTEGFLACSDCNMPQAQDFLHQVYRSNITFPLEYDLLCDDCLSEKTADVKAEGEVFFYFRCAESKGET